MVAQIGVVVRSVSTVPNPALRPHTLRGLAPGDGFYRTEGRDWDVAPMPRSTQKVMVIVLHEGFVERGGEHASLLDVGLGQRSE